MRRALTLLAFLVWVAPANAAPSVTVQASATLGQAPLDVTLTATGDAVAYHWDLGDRTRGRRADRPAPLRARSLHGDRHGDRDRRQHSPRFRHDHVGQAHPDGTQGRHVREADNPSRPSRPGAARRADCALFGRNRGHSRQGEPQGSLPLPRPPDSRLGVQRPPRERRVERRRSRRPAGPRRRAAEHAHARTAARPPRQAQAPRLGNAQGAHLARRSRAASARVRRSRPAAPEHEAHHRLCRPDHRQAERQLPRPTANLSVQRLRPVPSSGDAGPERENPRAAARTASLRPARRGHVLLVRHRRRGARVPESSRARRERGA